MRCLISPEAMVAGSIGVTGERWGVNLGISYADAMRTSAGTGPIPVGEGTDSRFLVDLSADYTIFSRYKIFAQLRNLTDEIYVAARRPYGARPGLPRKAMVGLSLKF